MSLLFRFIVGVDGAPAKKKKSTAFQTISSTHKVLVACCSAISGHNQACCVEWNPILTSLFSSFSPAASPPFPLPTRFLTLSGGSGGHFCQPVIHTPRNESSFLPSFFSSFLPTCRSILGPLPSFIPATSHVVKVLMTSASGLLRRWTWTLFS